MQQEFEQVCEFHGKIGALIQEQPGLLDSDPQTATTLAEGVRHLQAEAKRLTRHPDDLAARLALTLEETAEWLESHAANDLIGAMDAWGDRCYVLLGDAVATGLCVNQIFAEVHESNMTKESLNRDVGGKAVKGKDYLRPVLEESKS